ncbi:MAG: hypothetical protein EBU90_01255 [Proteobacteria bacterium]|nr:hypothetical protein [Pseudomonadota bacterium]NBP12788.1 hypothetical protein [bacterium]
MTTQYQFAFRLTQAEQGDMVNQPPENPNENWKVHPRFNSYEISDLGNVRNIYTKKLRNLIKKNKNSSNSYLKVGINDPSFNKNYGFVSVHKLVAETWMGEEYDRSKQIHHLDGDCSNNMLSNLQQLTKAEHKAEHAAIYAMFTKEGVLLKVFTNRDELKDRNLNIVSIRACSTKPSGLHKKHIFRNIRRFPKMTQWQVGNTYDFVINNSKGDFCV